MMANAYPVPPWMFGAVQNVESGGNPYAVSLAGAQGPMQVMPQTASNPGFGVQPAMNNTPQELQRVGQDYLSAMMNRYHGNQEQALQAYNWGPGNEDKLLSGQIQQPPAETQAYVPKVMSQAPQIGFPEAQYAQNTMQANDASPQASATPQMPKMALMLEAEKRGILPDDKLALLTEARKRGLIAGGEPQAQTQQPSGMEDAMKSFAGGLERGAAGTAMILPNLMNAAVAGPQYLGRGIADTIEGNPTDKNFQPWQPFFSSEDALKQLPEAIQPHEPQTAGGVVGDIVGQLAGSIGAGKALQGMGGKVTDMMTEKLTPEDIRTASGQSYDQMRSAGASLNQQGAGQVVSSVEQALQGTGLMNSRLHGGTLSVLDDLKDAAKGGSLDLEKLDQLRQLFSQAVKADTTKFEGSGPDAMKAQVAIKAIDDAVGNLGPQHLASGTPQAIESLNTARTLYSAQARMNGMQQIVENAYMTDNPATAIKTGFRNLAKQVNVNSRGYSDDEIAAINHAAHTGILTGALKLMGSRLGPLMMGAAGYAGGGVLGGAASGATDYMLSGAARAGANALQEGRANDAISMIANRPEVLKAMGITPPPDMPTLKPAVAASMGNNAVRKRK